LLGHIFGDYIAGQNDWMALNKKKRILPCFVHCLLYTFWISVFLSPEIAALSLGMSALFVVFVFFSHYVVDRVSLDGWYNLIKGRSFKRIDFPSDGICSAPIQDVRTVRFIYTAFVQTVGDNGLHLFLMYFILKLFF
jgi:hypothetical protein